MSERLMHGLGEVYDIASPSVKGFAEKLSYGQEMHGIVDPMNFIAEVSERIKGGAYPVLYSNHTQHLNIAGMREVVECLNPRPDDIYVAIAHSLVNKGQNPKIIEFAKNLSPVLEQERMHLVPVAREQDRAKLSTISEDAVNEAKRDTIHNLRELSGTFKEDAGFVFFPEATTEGAVKVNGKRQGMIEITDNLFAWIASNSQRHNRDVVFVPIGMVGVNNILEPRTTSVHMKPAMEIVLKKRIAPTVGLSLGPIEKFAQVVVGQPFGLQDIWEDGVGEHKRGKFYFHDDRALNTYMGRRVAQLLPQEMQGAYSEPRPYIG